jgi:hypothetical protein
MILAGLSLQKRSRPSEGTARLGSGDPFSINLISSCFDLRAVHTLCDQMCLSQILKPCYQGESLVSQCAHPRD